MATGSALKWDKLEDITIPEVNIMHINDYFITRMVDDGMPAKDYKDLNSHSYPLFKAGHIQSVFVAMQNNKYLFKCVCLPEMKKDVVYRITLSVNSKGQIETATCECPAGVGPTGRCKHVCALCYALEEFCRIKKLRSPKSCTSELQKWNQPRKRKLDACAVDNIDFVKHPYGKEKKELQSLIYDPRPPALRSTSKSSVETLRQGLLQTEKDIVLIHLLPNAASVNTTPSSPHLPPSPLVVRDQILQHLQSQPQPLNCRDISTAGLALIEAFQYTEEQRKCRHSYQRSK